MSKRIRQLAEQAGYQVDMFGVGHWDMPECKKFAELIVRECAELADEPTSRPFQSYGAMIKQHFGVE